MNERRNGRLRSAPLPILPGKPRGGTLLKILVLLIVVASLAGAAYLYIMDAPAFRSTVGKIADTGAGAAERLARAENMVFWYTVGPDEVALVQRFGAYVREVGPGLHMKLPLSIETVRHVRVKEIRRVEVGFRTLDDGYAEVAEESLMLTGDENIVNLKISVQYMIKNAYDYIFKVSNVEKVVKDAAQAAIRLVVGGHEMDEVLTTGKGSIQIEAMDLLQKILDTYGAGIKLIAVQLQDVHPPDEVIQAFKDVVSAKEDRQRSIDEARSYYNEIVPMAQGKANEVVNQSEAAKQERILRAEGDVEVFNQLRTQYELAPEVTRMRIYYEGMEKILGDADTTKIILTEEGKDLYKLLPLQQIR